MDVQRYLVELERPADGWGSVLDAVEHARSGAAEMRAGDEPVRLIRSLYVPEDDTWFLLVEGPSADAAARVARAARIGVVGVVAAVRVGEDGVVPAAATVTGASGPWEG